MASLRQEGAGASDRAAPEITLYAFGPFLGTPDSSPFVIKTMLLLKLAGLPYRVVRSVHLKAPRRLLPYIEDAGAVVTDSTLIRRHLERKYGVDFDRGLGAEQKATAWAVERLCEDHLYFALLTLRWLDDANFRDGLGRYAFGAVPWPLRPMAKAMLRRSTARRLFGHGLGRRERAEIANLAMRDLDAIATLLGAKPYLMGERPCGADATVFGMLTAIMTPPLRSPIVDAARRHATLVAYRDRIMARYFAMA